MRKSKKRQKLIKALFTFSICVFAISAVSKIYLCSSLAVKNATLKECFHKKKALTKEISDLTFEDSSLSSIKNVEQKAYDLGFIKMETRLQALDTTAPVQVASLNY